MTSAMICCIPDCKSNFKFKHSSFIQIKPEWRKLIVSYMKRHKKAKNWQSHQTLLQTICGRHVNLCGIRQGTPEETWIHFPYLKLSVCRKKPLGTTNLVPRLELPLEKIDPNVTILGNELSLGCEVTTANTTEPSVCLNEENLNVNRIPTEEHQDHTYALTLQSVHLLKDNCVELNTENENLKNNMKDLTEKYEKEIQRLKDITHSLITASIKAQSKVISPFINILDSERMLKFYTGFSSPTSFKNFANILKPSYELARLQEKKENSRIPRKDFEYEQQLILVLCRLRLGLLQHDLAYRFNVSATLISHVWSFWVNLLSVQLINESIKLNKEIEHGHRNRIILECLETFVDNSSLNQQTAKLVANKSHSRAKGVIEVSPNGFISFVSDLHPGNIDEKELMEQCKFSGTSSQLGFALSKKKHVNMKQTSKSGRYTALQTHIKRILGFIKGFKILKGVFPNAIHSRAQLNSFWKICCYLVNFINGPLIEN